MKRPTFRQVKNLIAVFLFLAAGRAECSEIKYLEGVATGWEHFDRPTNWATQPIVSYVDEDGRFYLAIGSERTVRGFFEGEQLQSLIQDIRTAQSLAAARQDTPQLINSYTHKANDPQKNTIVELTFQPTNSGGALDLFVQDFRNPEARLKLRLLPEQMQALLALLERVPSTIDAITKKQSPPVPPPAEKSFRWLGWVLGIPLGVAVVALVVQQLIKAQSIQEKDQQLAKAAEAARELNSEIQNLNKTHGEQAKKLADASTALAKAETDHANQLKEVRAMLVDAAFTRTISERELVKAFIEMVTIRRLDQDTPSPTSGVHDLSQTQEQALADIMAHDRNRFILIEFKRELARFSLELTEKAEVRQPQIERIRSTPGMAPISVKCHFGGWGVLGRKTPIEFAPYLDTWTAFESHLAITSTVSIDKFIDGFLPKVESEARYGAPAPEFRAYIKLLENIAPKSGSNSATAPLLLVVRTSDNLPQFIPVPSMMFLIQMVQAIELKIEQQKKIAQELSQKAPHQSKGFGRGISRSGSSPTPPIEHDLPDL